MTVDLTKLKYEHQSHEQHCGDSSFGMANHAGCWKKTNKAFVMTNHPLMSGIMSSDQNVYIFCCEDCHKKYMPTPTVPA